METNQVTQTTDKKSSYSESHRRYYEKNKDKCKKYQQEAKPYKSYYEKNKDVLNAKRLARYYTAKEARRVAAETPGPEIPGPETPGLAKV
jgi:hypothetical protein